VTAFPTQVTAPQKVLFGSSKSSCISPKNARVHACALWCAFCAGFVQ
jgi:hypothetical protein